MHIHGIPAPAESATPRVNNPKLASAAHEFEASLMKEFLKPLEHDSLFNEDKGSSSDDEEGSVGALMSFGSQAMATAISERGGFGIAKMILNHFRADAPPADSGNAPKVQGFRRTGSSPITKVLDPAADE